MRNALWSLLILLAACSLPVYVQGPEDPSTDAHLEGIENVWAVEVERVDGPQCAVVLHPSDEYESIDCIGNDAIGCAAALDVWCPDGYGGAVCAHEVGHVAGLRHVRTEDDAPNLNVMNPIAGASHTQTSAQQQLQVRALAGSLQACKRIRERKQRRKQRKDSSE